MLEIILLVGIVFGGVQLEKLPEVKKEIKTVFKKPYHFTKEEQEADLKEMKINSILRQLKNGKDELSRCPVNKICKEVSDLEIVK